MRPSLASLEKGHQFGAVDFELSPEWVREYIRSVEDGAVADLQGDAVPPMAIAALSVRALLEQAALPPGAIHLGQELGFHRAARPGERLTATARLISRGERQGWALIGVEMAVADAASDPVLSGRATLTFPLSGEAGG